MQTALGQFSETFPELVWNVAGRRSFGPQVPNEQVKGTRGLLQVPQSLRFQPSDKRGDLGQRPTADVFEQRESTVWTLKRPKFCDQGKGMLFGPGLSWQAEHRNERQLAKHLLFFSQEANEVAESIDLIGDTGSDRFGIFLTTRVSRGLRLLQSSFDLGDHVRGCGPQHVRRKT